MTCKFTNLRINESVILNIDSMYCYNCNNLSSYKGLAIYRGHGEFDGIVRDCFDITYKCPGCLRNIKQYIEACKGEVFVMELPVGIPTFHYTWQTDNEPAGIPIWQTDNE